MSKIDDQLAHSIYCGVWEASKNAPCTCDLDAARAELAALRSGFDEAVAGARKRADFMDRRGYRRCDIPACNCGSWHGGNAEDRLREICDELGQDMNGKIATEAIAALWQRAEDAVKVIAAERSEIWINFHTPTAQAAADELLKRIESAILKANTGS